MSPLYTPLKSRTPLNTVVGAVAGAMPTLMGWSAVGGSFSLAADGGGLTAATLFLIVYLWQFPHFMAIAWIYRRQYAAAGLKMLTVVDPSGCRAGLQAAMAALALLPVSLVPVVRISPGRFISPRPWCWDRVSCLLDAVFLRRDDRRPAGCCGRA